ncbi:tyrosine-protein phosphatase [Micromonospora parathelypteridis]|uniref:Protein-tyrosine phosphatase n=1 Tax=Micromonospora parathelypteridis TaxID=1839617 RepID=A0A840VHX8_9ACTN|nr:tyrosine-protein phosphatase [Micromonospora parathelypteridis]MBB5476482.1 protein-tyrosine phosphatase [Micromonospora parathelypteridis]GGO15417.1 protein-tyrosine-phosphatase [Micromonospora parathelypteridis]
MAGQGWELVGAPNARDLGGLVGADGRRVRVGQLIRTPALGRLADEDLPVLAKLGPACVLDLRDSSEIAVAPADRLVGEPRVVHLPVHDPEHPVFTYVSAVLLGHDLDAYAELARQGTARAMAAIYRWFVTGESARTGFAEAVRLATQSENLPLVYHCSAGKDRTGWLTVILLTALGVDESAIRSDYLRNNALTDSLRAVIVEALRRRQPGLDVDAVLPVLEVRAEYLDAAYDEVRRVHGSFDAYLRDGLGITDETLTALRARLLE